MRTVLSIALVLLTAWGVHHFLGTKEPPPRYREPDPVPEPVDEPGRPKALHATLVVHLVGPDKKPIEYGEVGTDLGGAVRWWPGGFDGTRTFSDMEPGTVRILGRAPGRVQAEQRRHLSAGVRTEVRLVLRPRQ